MTPVPIPPKMLNTVLSDVSALAAADLKAGSLPPTPPATPTTIPAKHIAFARALVALCREYNMAEIFADWRPPLGDEWGARTKSGPSIR